jgi:endonuclease YncB( thermonuclease family)
MVRAALTTSATALLLAGALADARAQPTMPRPQTIAGRAIVVDGETLEIKGQRIRLSGIESPADDHVCTRTDDERWRCGPRAVNALDELLEESIVSCAVRDGGTLMQPLATCTAAGLDLSLWLIRNGLALAASAATPRYRQAETEAKAARRGLWSLNGR